MTKEKRIVFDPFCLDLPNERLWKGLEAIKLTPKAFALLAYLVERPSQLVTKAALLDAVWPGTFVGDAVLKVTMSQIREALEDDSKCPRFIETAHRRGYRFIGQITDSGPAAHTPQPITADHPVSQIPITPADSPPIVVGRDETLSRLQEFFGKMIGGERQIVFITGEPGIGKTAVVDAFVRILAVSHNLRIGRGQCLEQYGKGEAYLPVLDAIGRLAREQPLIVDVLRAHAPMWLTQMPALVSIPSRELLHREMLGATRERMLREMGEALEMLTTDLPLVLILEDLHWSDYSTLDLVSYLAKQRQRSHLMLIGTYRTAELITSGHPLTTVKRELISKHQCEELPLDYLSKTGVDSYLSLRFPINRFPIELAHLIQVRTEGNPLFIVNMVDYLVAEGLISEIGEVWELTAETDLVQVGIPDSIKQVVERQLDRLEDTQRQVLEVASVVGAEFSTFTLAAGLGSDRPTVEACCDELVRQHQFIQDAGVQLLPNGEAVTKYSFIHDLYRTGLYETVSASRRVRLHRRLGDELEAIYGEHSKEIAGELAMNFELGRDFGRGAKYLQQAADKAIRRFAYREAVALSRRGLRLLLKLPPTPERTKQELGLQLTLGVPLIATEGYAAAEVGKVYLRARELCQQSGDTPDAVEALWGLWTFHTVRAELATARQIAGEFLQLADRLPYPGLAMRAHLVMEITNVHLGEFSLAIEHFERALSLYDHNRHLEDAFFYTQNPGMAMRCFGAWAFWFLGRPDEALVQIRQAVTLAHELDEPYGLAHAHLFGAVVHQLRHEDQMAEENAEAVITVSREHGLIMYEAMATIMQGWALLHRGRAQEAIETMQQGLRLLGATRTALVNPHYMGLLAEALEMTGQYEEGLRTLNEALEMAQRNGEGYYEAELHRLKGELLLSKLTAQEGATIEQKRLVVGNQPDTQRQAEACFTQAIMIARKQSAKSWELRAAMSMARLYEQQGKHQEGGSLLADVYGKFTEGFETADLQEAKAMLNQLTVSTGSAR